MRWGRLMPFSFAASHWERGIHVMKSAVGPIDAIVRLLDGDEAKAGIAVKWITRGIICATHGAHVHEQHIRNIAPVELCARSREQRRYSASRRPCNVSLNLCQCSRVPGGYAASVDGRELPVGETHRHVGYAIFVPCQHPPCRDALRLVLPSSRNGYRNQRQSDPRRASPALARPSSVPASNSSIDMSLRWRCDHV